MPAVEFQEAGVACTAEEGQDLRKIAKQNKVDVYGGPNKYLNCRGFGLCGTDRITVDPKDCVTPPTWKEKLQFGDNPKIRLACQAKLVDDAKISMAPAIEYGEEMSDALKILPAVVFFGGLTLFFVIFMAFELTGNPLF
jgi:ferredoxin